MSEFSSGQPGVLTSLKRVATNFVGILETRGELFVTELHEEKFRLIQIVIWTVVSVMLTSMAVILLTVMALFMFWDNPDHRIIALASLSGVYLIGAVIAACCLRRQVSGKVKPFAETLSQLKKDRECLKK